MWGVGIYNSILNMYKLSQTIATHIDMDKTRQMEQIKSFNLCNKIV